MPKKLQHVRLYCDGGCRGNPGPGAIGVLLLDAGGRELELQAVRLPGTTTNNRAEYAALIDGLKRAARYTSGEVACHMDSQLVIQQMSGRWRVRDPQLQELHREAQRATEAFRRVTFRHVNRTDPDIVRVDHALNAAFDVG